MRSAPLSSKRTGRWATACTASVWNGTPCSRATAASSATGCIVPTSLLAHMTLATAMPPGASASRRVSAPMWPQRSGSSQVTATPREPSRYSTGSSTAWCSMPLATTPLSAGSTRAAGQPGALDREVVGLGAPGGEHHLGGPRAQGGADPLAGLLDDGAGGASRGVQRRGVADPGRLLGERLERGGQHRGRRRVVEVVGHRPTDSTFRARHGRGTPKGRPIRSPLHRPLARHTAS